MPLFKRKAAAATEPQEEAKVKKAPAAKKTVKKVAKAPEAAEKKVVVKAGLSDIALTIKLTPLVTEKSAHLANAGVYAFEVPVTANRVSIRDAFRELYKVTPTNVNIIRVHGKEKRAGRFTTRKSDWKKALVSVPSGTRIDLFTL